MRLNTVCQQIDMNFALLSPAEEDFIGCGGLIFWICWVLHDVVDSLQDLLLASFGHLATFNSEGR